MDTFVEEMMDMYEGDLRPFEIHPANVFLGEEKLEIQPVVILDSMSIRQ